MTTFRKLPKIVPNMKTRMEDRRRLIGNRPARPPETCVATPLACLRTLHARHPLSPDRGDARSGTLQTTVSGAQLLDARERGGQMQTLGACSPDRERDPGEP